MQVEPGSEDYGARAGFIQRSKKAVEVDIASVKLVVARLRQLSDVFDFLKRAIVGEM